MCNEKKDFSLLRPFDLEAAKRGEAICLFNGAEDWKYISGPDSKGFLCLEVKQTGVFNVYSKDVYCMAPLCWVRTSVEDDTLKPVYRGDSVYTGNYSCNFVVDKEDGGRIFFTNGGWLFVKDVTFTHSKVKRKIKMIGYKNKYDDVILIRDIHIEVPTSWKRFPQIDTTIEIEE